MRRPLPDDDRWGLAGQEAHRDGVRLPVGCDVGGSGPARCRDGAGESDCRVASLSRHGRHGFNQEADAAGRPSSEDSPASCRTPRHCRCLVDTQGNRGDGQGAPIMASAAAIRPIRPRTLTRNLTSHRLLAGAAPDFTIRPLY